MSYQDHLSENPAIVAPASVAAKMMAFRTELARVVAMVREVIEDGKAKDLNATALRDFKAIRDEAEKLADAASALEDVAASLLG